LNIRKGLGIILLALNGIISAQSSYLFCEKKDTFSVNIENKYYLSSVAILPKTLEIKIDTVKVPAEYFRYHKDENYFELSDSVHVTLADTLIASYKCIRTGLKRTYEKRRLVKVNEKIFGGKVRKAQSLSTALSNRSIFGENIRKSGTILRGFTIGTNQDFKLNSGLRLQLAGKLAENIDLVAALTDENTPIQPEGNTERLEELDKVFIQLKSPFATGVFGDYEFASEIGTFGKITRKLQGLQGEFRYENNSVKVAYASSRGKFWTNRFNGLDGVQGPYRLTGKNNQRDIVIIAGSERVYLDGKLLKRGENNDYTIEYANAEITFTPKRMITSASRISVDFEYTDRKFKRDFIGASAQLKGILKNLDVKMSFFSEGDNKNNPLDVILSEDDKRILQRAGDDRNKAVKSGVTLGKKDSLGIPRGTYLKRDTLINGQKFFFYVYAPGNDSSFYNVSFSYIGTGKGDYIKESLGNYKFVGIGKGEYLPLVYLPLPQTHKGGNVVFSFAPFENFSADFELAGSITDLNAFSPLDDADNSGYARNLFLRLKETKINVRGKTLASVGFSLHDRYVENKFLAFSRFNPVEFNRDYNIGENEKGNELLREAELKITSFNLIKIGAEYGKLQRGKHFVSERFATVFSLTPSRIGTVDFKVNLAKSKNGELASNWIEQKGDAELKLWELKPGLSYNFEKKESLAKDSLLGDSHKYFEIAPYLKLNSSRNLETSLRYSFREEYFPIGNVLNKESRATLATLHLKYSGNREFSTTFDISWRNKKIERDFVSEGKTDNRTVLIYSDSRFGLFKNFLRGSFFYKAATERTAKMNKVFVRVPVGNGNYIYLGDLNKNGIADDFEFRQTEFNGDYILTTVPTDKLYPTMNLKTNMRLKTDFGKIVRGNGFLRKILGQISTETFYRIEEKSTEENLQRIYLLNLKYFLREATTIHGMQTFQNDVYFGKRNRELSLRYRFLQTKRLNKYSSGTELGYYREHSLRMKFRVIKGVNNRTVLKQTTRNSLAPAVMQRSFQIKSQSLSSEFSYYLLRNLELGFSFLTRESEDAFPRKPIVIDENSQTLRITVLFKGRGRLRFEAERIELEGETHGYLVPFEITEGNAIGKNYILRLNFDYRIASNLQVNVAYWGRKIGEGKFVHNLRAEARAYF